jgi:hypothetical protein
MISRSLRQVLEDEKNKTFGKTKAEKQPASNNAGGPSHTRQLSDHLYVSNHSHLLSLSLAFNITPKKLNGIIPTLRTAPPAKMKLKEITPSSTPNTGSVPHHLSQTL